MYIKYIKIGRKMDYRYQVISKLYTQALLQYILLNVNISLVFFPAVYTLFFFEVTILSA